MKKKWILSFILVFALSLSACTTSKEETPDIVEEPPVDEVVPEEGKDESPPVVESDEKENASLYEEIKISPMDAFDIYIEKYPATKVKKVQLDKDFGYYVYKVEGFDKDYEYEIKINPVTGEIIRDEKEMDTDQDVEIAKDQLKKVTGIVDLALEDAGDGAIIEEWTLEVEDGKVVIEVEIERPGLDDIEYLYDLDGNLLKKDQ